MSKKINNTIKKFKNGNVNITFKGTIEELENFYNNDMFMMDLDLHHDEGNWFLIDSNKLNVYYLDNYSHNVFEYLCNQCFKKDKTVKFYPSNDEIETKEILKSFYGN